MGEIVGDIFRIIFNFLGACIRWALGSFWRALFKKTRFTFKQYLNGPKKQFDKFDDFDESKNIITGGSFFFIAVIIIIKYFL
jgi:hypothetical protein